MWLQGPRAAGLAAGCQDRQVEAPEAAGRPVGIRGVQVVAFPRSWSPDGNSDCKLMMHMEVGRLGAPAAGRLRKAGQTCKLKRRKRQADPSGSGGKSGEIPLVFGALRANIERHQRGNCKLGVLARQLEGGVLFDDSCCVFNRFMFAR